MHDHGNCARCDAQEERIARLEGALGRILEEIALRDDFVPVEDYEQVARDPACDIGERRAWRAVAYVARAALKDQSNDADTTGWQRVHEKDTCDHPAGRHLRPMVLAAWREGDLVTGITRYARMACFACGARWTEET